tara:strand:+ start:4 stop:1098 length:1095 start_codon:yes stop_codon:yes gene_type:complete
MEEIKAKLSRLPNAKDVINYKDFFGEYPLIFAIKIISSISLIYVISEFYSYHNPLDTYITKHIRGKFTTFNPNPDIFVLWGFIAGFILYIFTLFKGRYKFLILILTVILVGQYISDPALDWKLGEHIIPSRIGEEGAERWTWKPVKVLYDDKEGSEKRINDFSIRASNLIFGSIPFLGAYGIWKRKGWAIAASIGLAIIIGFLYNPNLCLENFDAGYCGYETEIKEKTWEEYLSGGIFIGMGLIIYVELSYAAIKYENYAEQFKPAGLDDSLLTKAQKKGVSRTLTTLFVSYLVNLGVMLVITFLVAQVVVNVNDYLAATDGRIQDSIELQGPYGIVFTSLIFFMLLGFVRMFIGADYQTEKTN